VLLAAAVHAHAQSVANVPASSDVYGMLESISAFFPTRGVFLGERPQSGRQLRTALDRLHRTVDGAPNSARRDWALSELAVVETALRATAKLRGGSNTTLSTYWRAEVTGSDARTDVITPNGLGAIDAVTNPFEARRDGRPVIEGTVASFLPASILTVRSGFALAIQPRFSHAWNRGASSTEGRIHRGYAQAVVHNVSVRLGAEELLWGQSPIGALFISGNAVPMPAFVLGTDTAITLPWLFRFAGPVRATGMLADLGRWQDPPHAKLAGWQVSIQPWSRFELGVAVLSQTGGSGGPKATFLERVVDLFPAIDALAPQHADLQISNKLAGGNLRLRFPELSGLDVYYELQIDDFDGRRLRSSMWEDAAHLVGLRVPYVVDGHEVSWRAEWHHTSLRLYEHAQFRSGVTYRDRIIGDPLGPNAGGLYVSSRWRATPLSGVEIAYAAESRDPSQYAATSADPRDRGFRFIRVTDDARLRRGRAMLALDRATDAGAIRLTLGNSRFRQSGQRNRSEWLAELSLRSHHLPTF
jgi:hypothetical protein